MEKSKTQLKNDSHKLQQLGVKFTQLTPPELEKLLLAENIIDAINAYNLITSNIAKKRQMQLIGKLLRNCDNLNEVTNIYQKHLDEQQGSSASNVIIESWRTKLLHDGKSAITQFVEQYGKMDLQKLRLLIKNAQNDKKNAGKLLFRFIREQL